MITIVPQKNQNTKNLRDPKIIGPGIWWFLHNKASLAKTKEQKKAFLDDINLLRQTFPCLECRTHLDDYAKKNPPEKYININKGLFIWTWNCHNNANSITNKSQFPYDDAEKLYFSPEVCESFCSNTDHPPPPPPTVEKATPIPAKLVGVRVKFLP